MGYTTEFKGKIEIAPALPAELVKYINQFGDTRRMKRNSELLKKKFNGEFGFNGGYGTDGEYFVGGGGFAGQAQDETIQEYNYPPSTQPGLWCQWVVSDDGNFIEWDGSEKFYESAEWMKYIINNFIKDGHVCNGKIEAQGEDPSDRWKLIVENNVVKKMSASWVWEEEK